jgi:hypothetical protein
LTANANIFVWAIEEPNFLLEFYYLQEASAEGLSWSSLKVCGGAHEEVTIITGD